MTLHKIQHPNLKNEYISYGFFTRNGGVSKHPFDSLNCSFNVNDKENNVKKNLKLICQELKLKNLVKLNQIHSSDVIIIDKHNKNNSSFSGDGLVTNLTGIGLSILGADCAPILFADPISGVIGAAHAGWRGAIDNIIESTIISMENIGANRENIIAIIGPTIQKQSYEIKEDVAQIVRDSSCFKESISFKRNSSILSQMNNNKYLFDLPLLLKESLKSFSIRKVNDVNINTYENNNLFFSHRYSSHKNFPKVGVTGRHISVIGILK